MGRGALPSPAKNKVHSKNMSILHRVARLKIAYFNLPNLCDPIRMSPRSLASEN